MKMALIGCSGHWPLAMVTRAEADAALVGIAPGPEGSDMAPVRETAQRNGHEPNMYADWRTMLDREKPDVVTVDSEYRYHAAVAAEALRRGMHVFCEKPVATTLDDLAMLRAAHAQSGAHFAGMLELRYSPEIAAAWQAVQEGHIGAVRLVTAQKSYRLGSRGAMFKSRERSGGTIPWVGTHAFDWIRWMAGVPFETVFAAQTRRGNAGHEELEIAAVCAFRMADEILATANIDYLRPKEALSHGDDRVRVAGTVGIVEARHGAAYIMNPDGTGERELPLLPKGVMFLDFLAQIRGTGACRITAAETFENTYVALMARESADTGRLLSLTDPA